MRRVLWITCVVCTLTRVCAGEQVLSLDLPPRPKKAVGGRAFIERVLHLSLQDREEQALKEISKGNVPAFLRRLKTIHYQANGHEGKVAINVMVDYLAIGGDQDFVRMPLTPWTAQRIAGRLRCVLPTCKIVDAIDKNAQLHVAPRPMTVDRESPATFLRHHAIIERQLKGQRRSALVTGIKKDVVLTLKLLERSNHVAIYGWRKLNGQPIQSLTTVHKSRYVDYSHGVRLVSDRMLIGKKEHRLSRVLVDPELSSTVSDEGPLEEPRYSSGGFPRK